MAVRKYNTRPKYSPAVRTEPYQPDFVVENDFDYTSPYPCMVCKVEFRSRRELATHSHPKKGA